MEKHTKLETIFDRIELIKTRFEVLKRDAMIERLVKKLEWYEARTSHLQQERKEAFELIEEIKLQSHILAQLKSEFMQGKQSINFHAQLKMIVGELVKNR